MTSIHPAGRPGAIGLGRDADQTPQSHKPTQVAPFTREGRVSSPPVDKGRFGDFFNRVLHRSRETHTDNQNPDNKISSGFSRRLGFEPIAEDFDPSQPPSYREILLRQALGQQPVAAEPPSYREVLLRQALGQQPVAGRMDPQPSGDPVITPGHQPLGRR